MASYDRWSLNTGELQLELQFLDPEREELSTQVVLRTGSTVQIWALYDMKNEM